METIKYADGREMLPGIYKPAGQRETSSGCALNEFWTLYIPASLDDTDAVAATHGFDAGLLWLHGRKITVAPEISSPRRKGWDRTAVGYESMIG